MVQPMLQELLQKQKVVILDGALGTELERRGKVISNSKLWSAQLLLDDPALLESIHLDYLRAGADVITTATYQASLIAFQEAGLSDEQFANAIKLAVDLAAGARDQFWQEHTAARSAQALRQRPLIGLSCGSFGASLCDGSEFTGTYAESMTIEQLVNYHHSRLDPVKNHPSVDMLCFETVPCLNEAHAIIQLLKEYEVTKPAWISFSCKDGFHTNHGENFAEECIPVLLSCPNVVAIGVNCTAPQHVKQLMQDAAAKLAELEAGQADPVKRILLCYPNSGEQWDCAGRCWIPAPGVSEPDNYAAHAKEWVAAGAQMVGGCCRTGPDHITAMRRALLQE